MSSLAATQADGYYIPSTHFDNTKQGRQPPSKNQVAQSKGHNQFLQRGVVRFELPYSGLCEQCGQYIGRGTRFNAQKKEAGKYLTSAIWKFEMTCRNCHTQTFVIQTNPQEYGFDYLQGITKLEHKKELSSMAGKSLENNATTTATGGSDLDRLESAAHGQRTVMSDYDELQALQTLNGKAYLHDADVNAHIRSKFRTERNAQKLRVEKGKQKGWIKPGMQLLDEDQDMAQAAKSMRFGPATTSQQQHQEAKYRQLQTSSIFDKEKDTTSRRRSKRQRPLDGSLNALPDVASSATPIPERSMSSQQTQNSKPKRLVIVQMPMAGRQYALSSERRAASAAATVTFGTTNSLSVIADNDNDNNINNHQTSQNSLESASSSNENQPAPLFERGDKRSLLPSHAMPAAAGAINSKS